jgi:hypothetical protein
MREQRKQETIEGKRRINMCGEGRLRKEINASDVQTALLTL